MQNNTLLVDTTNDNLILLLKSASGITEFYQNSVSLSASINGESDLKSADEIAINNQTSLENIRNSEKLVYCVEAFLQQNKLSFSDITNLIVINGPGSFTGCRIGIAFAKGLMITNKNLNIIALSKFDIAEQLFQNKFEQSKQSNYIITKIDEPNSVGIYDNRLKKYIEFISLDKDEDFSIENINLKYNFNIITDDCREFLFNNENLKEFLNSCNINNLVELYKSLSVFYIKEPDIKSQKDKILERNFL